MARHIHVHIHRTPTRTRDAEKPDPDREALVTALMAAIAEREGKTQDADFKEEDHPRDHGKFTSGGSSGPSGPKPTSATAKGSKAAVHELLSSGHRFSVDELMKATGCSNKSTLMTALADLKNPKYAGKLGALKIEKHADGGYHVVKDFDKKDLPIHPDLLAVTRPGAPIPGGGKKPTKAEEEDMATRAGEPRVGAAPKGAVKATWGQAPDRPMPQSSKLPIHPELAAVTDPGGTVPGSGKTPTKAEESRMAARAGEPPPSALSGEAKIKERIRKVTESYNRLKSSGAGPIQLTMRLQELQELRRELRRELAADKRGVAPAEIKKKVTDTPGQATSKAVHDPSEGTHHVVTLPSGAVHKVQRLNSVASMGLPGWHVISDKPNGKKGWEAHQPSYMGDTKQEAIRALIDREARSKKR